MCECLDRSNEESKKLVAEGVRYVKICKRLITEYRMLSKPKCKDAVKETVKVMGMAFAGAVAVWCVDTAFGTLVGMFL